MPIFQVMPDFDSVFATLREPPIIVNDMPSDTIEQRELVNDTLTSRYSSDLISLLPSCRCGETKGEFSSGTICPKCNSGVHCEITEDLLPLVWFRKPEGVAPLINPLFLHMLKTRFNRQLFNTMLWLMDSSFVATSRNQTIRDKLLVAGIERGYNSFYENFDKIMDFLFTTRETNPKPPASAGETTDYLLKFIEANRSKLFSNYLPLPNKSLLIIEKSALGRYIDPTIYALVDGIRALVSIDTESGSGVRFKANRTARALHKLSACYCNYFDKSLSPKEGQFRQHIYGTRANFTFRTVNTSITEPHNYTDLHAPWGAFIATFRPHLINKLLKIGFDLNSAIGLLLSNIEKYHPVIDQLITELIEESPGGKGIPVLIHRNPSLFQGSAQRVNIVKVKKDPTDHTTSVSILIVKQMNMDFDGDEGNVPVAIDNFMAEKWGPLSPHFNVFSLNKPFAVSSALTIPKPVVASISSWLDS